jgi:hypothetical protein
MTHIRNLTHGKKKDIIYIYPTIRRVVSTTDPNIVSIINVDIFVLRNWTKPEFELS